MLRHSAVFPIDGRPATTISSPGWNPPVISSRSVSPVGMPPPPRGRGGGGARGRALGAAGKKPAGGRGTPPPPAGGRGIRQGVPQHGPPGSKGRGGARPLPSRLQRFQLAHGKTSPSGE